MSERNNTDLKAQGYYIYTLREDGKGGHIWVRDSMRYFATLRGVKLSLNGKSRDKGKYRAYSAALLLHHPPYYLLDDDTRLLGYSYEQEIKPEVLIY